MTYKNLLQFNLDEKEAKVYLASLELGETNIQRISKKSGVKRTTVYDCIESLKDKGLISSIIKKKKTYYYAEDPRKIENQLEERRENLKKMLPELLAIANVIDKKPKIRYFEGIEGIKDVYKETLKYPDQEILAWITGLPLSNAVYHQFFYDCYTPKRKEKKIWVRMISSDDEEMKKYKDDDEKTFKKTKLVDRKQFPFRASINIFGGSKILIVSFEEQIGLIIESEKIFTTMKSIFELNWLNLHE